MHCASTTSKIVYRLLDSTLDVRIRPAMKQPAEGKEMDGRRELVVTGMNREDIYVHIYAGALLQRPN